MEQKEDSVAYFVAFCIELYKNANHISGGEATNILSRHGIVDYLIDNYGVLHTQSPGWILSDIQENLAK